ncbi:MAG: D-alanine--D-alanine ligase [Lachnospiraceae bacterium]|nr:D-alanine--D-alanine ligase [Lachnospiraceae bacterium]
MKKNIAVLFGGQSSEHEISVISAQTVIRNLDPALFSPILIGITKEGHWVLVDDVEKLVDGTWKDSKVHAILSPDATEKCIFVVDGDHVEKLPVDVAFPVLHGKWGEDGTVQGLFELAQIPYVGCGVLASAVSMDKYYTKQIVNGIGIAQAKYVIFFKADVKRMDEKVAEVEEKLGYPVFIKPCNAGSSCGVSKATNEEELRAGIMTALQHDREVLIEEMIVGREIECAVLGARGEVEASGVGEILAAADFYDYEAKYHNAESKTVLHPEFPEGKEEEVRQAARAVFRAVDGFGLSRVDFFLEKGTNRVIFNEINTLPGFTAVSMYPMLWEERGIAKKDLVARLIFLAYER